MAQREVGAGAPEDLVASAVKAAVSAAKEQPSTPQPDPHVATAFALGWQIAELYRPDSPSHVPPANLEDLPGIGKLDEAQRQRIALRQVQAALAKLAEPMEKGHVAEPDLAELETCLMQPTDAGTQQDAVRKLHVELLESLTAADFRLGKAYGIGRSLADTTRNPASAETLLAELEPHRIAQLRERIDDLATALPAHAGHGVSISLARWTERLFPTERPETPGTTHEAGDQLERASEALPVLERQGQLWRALLSGEKSGPDMLRTRNYIDAVWRLLRRYWPLIALVLLLFVGGLTYIIIEGSKTAFVAGVSAIVASFGLTWKGVGSTLGAAGAKAELHIWGGEIDTAIADAVTLLAPQQKRTLLGQRTERSRDYAGRRELATLQSPKALTVSPELLEPVLNPERLLEKVQDLQAQAQKQPASALPPGAAPRPGYLGEIAAGIEAEKGDPQRVQRAPTRTGPAAAAPPPVVYLSRKPSVSQFMSVITHCFEESLTSPPLERLLHLSALEHLWQDLERLSEELRARFREFGPCDIGFIQTKLYQLAASITPGGLHPFSQRPPVAPLADKAAIILLGDWATGLPQARNVSARIAEQLAAIGPDTEIHVVHLGDTYYSGLEDECRRRFLDLWPVAPGSRAKSWTLAGNHDMYSGGHGYFEVLLADPRFAHQERCSYFAIANRSWQIVGLDSAYKDPDRGSLQEPQAEWLKARVGEDSSRGTILLTHHQPFSAYEDVETPLPGEVDAAVAPNKLSAWFWGHEHRCLVYNPGDETEKYKDVAMYEAVVGHGGVPTMRQSLSPEESKRETSWTFDDYYEVGDEQWMLGGFAVIQVDGERASVQYYDEYGKTRRSEGLGYPASQSGLEAARIMQDKRRTVDPDPIPRP
jgi:hypothetical protein